MCDQQRSRAILPSRFSFLLPGDSVVQECDARADAQSAERRDHYYSKLFYGEHEEDVYAVFVLLQIEFCAHGFRMFFHFFRNAVIVDV